MIKLLKKIEYLSFRDKNIVYIDQFEVTHDEILKFALRQPTERKVEKIKLKLGRLLSCGYLVHGQNVEKYSVFMTKEGFERLHEKRKADIRYWITTSIAILAVIASVVIPVVLSD